MNYYELEDIPESLKLTAEQRREAWSRAPAHTPAVNNAAAAGGGWDALKEAQKEKRKAKLTSWLERKAAKESGSYVTMPLTGKEALAKIKEGSK